MGRHRGGMAQKSMIERRGTSRSGDRSGRVRRTLRPASVGLLLFVTAACGDGGSESDPAGADPAAPADGSTFDDDGGSVSDLGSVDGDFVDVYCDAVEELLAQFASGDAAGFSDMDAFEELVTRAQDIPADLGSEERQRILDCAAELSSAFTGG